MTACGGSRPAAPPLSVSAVAIPNVFTGLSSTEFDSLVDMRFVDTNRLFAAEIKGRIYVLDVGPSGKITLRRSFTVEQNPLPSGQSLQQIGVVSRRAAYATSPGAEKVYLFDPEVDDASSVRKLEIGGNVRIEGGARLDSSGAPSGEFDPSFVHTAVKIGEKLFVTCSNLQSNFTTYNPGAILVYDLDPQDPLHIESFAGTPRDVTVSAGPKPRGAIFTSSFNPQSAIPYETEGGKTLLLVANSGVYDFQANAVTEDGSIDVIDPDREEVIATYPLAGQSPVGLAVAKRRLYAGSSLFSSVSVLDLRGLDALAGNLGARVLERALALPRIRPGGLNFVPDVAASESGRFVYAVNENDSSVTAIENGATPRVAGQFEVPGRHVGAFESLTSFVEVRPGKPGKAYRGPDLFTGAIFLAELDETPPNSGNDNAIDAFETAPR
jgi:hypothetical protein